VGIKKIYTKSFKAHIVLMLFEIFGSFCESVKSLMFPFKLKL